MQPTGDLVRQLFSSVEPERVDVFSCGHVIPKNNLLPLCVSRWLCVERSARGLRLTARIYIEIER